ncbi:MAG: TatD family hydrolase [Candidatus Pacebacteria bacterium]|nr:TatD family hydrolase [Candidatus Paceibacterota bacterium]MBP9843139.1 TatD family hydrolase [Candidatus Paceibacterota bacterium]
MESKYIDTHAHLNLSAFNEDVEVVTVRCKEEGVAVINVGTKESTSARAVELAEQYEHLYAIIGLHPIQTVPGTHDEEETGEGAKPFASKGEFFNKSFYEALAKSKKVVGVGECGFDYWHCPPETYTIQEENFIEQIEFANKYNFPLMIHTRGPKPGMESPTGRSVYLDVYETLKQYAKVPFNVHFYAGTYEEATKFFDLGGTISFTGVITFAKAYEEIVKAVPLDLIHGETDCPYVAPIPHRGKRAEPWMVQEVYKKIATIRGEDEEMVREQLLKNATRLYKLPGLL